MICVCPREETKTNSSVQRGKIHISFNELLLPGVLFFLQKWLMERQGILEGLQLFGSMGEGSVVRELPREGRLRACLGSYSSHSSIILSSFCCSGLRELAGDLGGVAFSFDLLSNRRCILLLP